MVSLESLEKQIKNLTKEEKTHLIYKLLESSNNEDIINLFQNVIDKAECIEILKIIEPVFRDWNNDEDEVYDNL